MAIEKDTAVMEKINFPTQYTKKTDKFLSETGSEFLPTYKYSMVKNVKELVSIGKTNIYERIQAERDAVDINKLIARFENGETDVFDRVHGEYFDVVDYPKNFAEMQERLIAAENHFYSLPPELREAFNNNPIEFYDQFGNDEFQSKLNKLYPEEVFTPNDSIEKEGTLDE